MNKKQYDKAIELHNMKTRAKAVAEGYEILDSVSEVASKRAIQLAKAVAKNNPFFHVIEVIDIRDNPRFDWTAYVFLARIRNFDRNLSVLDKAMEPKRAEVVAHQVARGLDQVNRIFALLAEKDNDLNAYAPYPSTRDYDYSAKKDLHNFVLGLCSYENYGTSHRAGAVLTVTRDEAKVARYLANVEKNAHADFDSYLTKLAGKVGAVTEATLDSVYLWSGSTLTVKTEAGEVQKWKTQVIVNFSSLGKAFNQWPTRLVK